MGKSTETLSFWLNMVLWTLFISVSSQNPKKNMKGTTTVDRCRHDFGSWKVNGWHKQKGRSWNLTWRGNNRGGKPGKARYWRHEVPLKAGMKDEQEDGMTSLRESIKPPFPLPFFSLPGDWPSPIPAKDEN